MLITEVTTTLGNVEIGLSKQLKDLLTSDLTDDIVNAAGTDKRVRIASVWGDGFPDIPATSTGAMTSSQLNDYSTIFLNPSDSQNYSCGVGNAYSYGMYVRSVLVYIPSTEYLGTDEDNLYAGNPGDVRIVTSVNIQDVHMYAYAWRENGSQMEAEDANSIYINNLRTKLRDNETNNTVTARGGCVYPAWLIVVGDKIAIWTGALCRAYDNYGNRSLYGNGNYNFPTFNGFNRMTVTTRMFDEDNTQIYPGGSGREIEYVYPDVEDYKIKWGFYEYYPYYWTAPVDRVTKAMYMDYVSRAGLYFVVGSGVNAKRYKPVITNGIVTGYTDDLTVESDIDEWTNINDHNIPPTPPPPGPTYEDDIEPVGYGYFSNTALGTLCALKNKLDIDKISQWLLSQTEGIDVAKNIISIKEIPFSLSTLGLQPLDIPLTIGGHNVTYGGSNLIVGEIVAPTIPTLNIVFADFDIPRLSNTYLDYNPYTKYELLLPFAPSPVTLPDWVIEKNVKAIFLYDIYTTACQYIIICNNERICAVTGTFGIDRAIAAQNVALRDSARLSAQLGTASSVIGGVISGAVGNINGVASGAISGISAINQYINAGKQNYMYTIGANSDSSSVGLYHAAHLKITRTLSIEDESYNHTYGRPLCKTRQLSNVSGFTICGNADTSSINTATTAERNAIQQLLTSGVYL